MNDQHVTDRDVKAAFAARAAGAPNPDLVGRISAETTRTRQSRPLIVLPGFGSQATTRLAWAAVLAALTVAVVGVLAFGVGRSPITSVVPSESPTSSAGPIVSPSVDPSVGPSPSVAPSPSIAPLPSVEPAGEVVAEASDELFRLVVRSPASAYAAGEQIFVTADLIYQGPADRETIFHASSPVGWRIAQLDGPAAMEGGMDMPCLTTEVDAGQPLRMPFEKAGGHDDVGPFTMAWFEEPGLQLPAGRWRITAELGVALGNCDGEPHQLEASIDLVVGQPTTEASPTPAQPAPSAGVAGLDPETLGIVVATDGLRVRSLPTVGEESERLEPTLPEGTRFFVVDGPVDADGYAWYQVQPYGHPWEQVEPAGAPPALPFGWVAAGSREGEPWIEHFPLGCDSIAPSAEFLAGGEPLEDLYCSVISSNPDITIDGDVYCTYADDHNAVVGPDWISQEGYCELRAGSEARRLYGEAVNGLLDPANNPVEGRYTITGHFDDPGASECEAFVMEGDEPPDPASVVLQCRTFFVVTEVTPVTP